MIERFAAWYLVSFAVYLFIAMLGLPFVVRILTNVDAPAWTVIVAGCSLAILAAAAALATAGSATRGR